MSRDDSIQKDMKEEEDEEEEENTGENTKKEGNMDECSPGRKMMINSCSQDQVKIVVFVLSSI